MGLSNNRYVAEFVRQVHRQRHQPADWSAIGKQVYQILFPSLEWPSMYRAVRDSDLSETDPTLYGISNSNQAQYPDIDIDNRPSA